MTHEEAKVIEIMDRCGGSFVQALAICFKRADPTNFKILKDSFNNYWTMYDNLYKDAITKKQEDEERKAKKGESEDEEG